MEVEALNKIFGLWLSANIGGDLWGCANKSIRFPEKIEDILVVYAFKKENSGHISILDGIGTFDLGLLMKIL